jgi:hypothetical protein
MFTKEEKEFICDNILRGITHKAIAAALTNLRILTGRPLVTEFQINRFRETVLTRASADPQ